MKKDSQPKFKIDVLIQSFKMNKFEKEIIDFLISESRIELYAILEKKKIKLLFKENISRIHHMSGIKDFIVFDYCKYDKIT